MIAESDFETEYLTELWCATPDRHENVYPTVLDPVVAALAPIADAVMESANSYEKGGDAL